MPVIITNPVAGQGGRSLADEVAGTFATADVLVTEYPGHAEELATKAAADGADLVVAVGGDGTVREVASGLVRAAGEAPPLRIVPAGTGNSTYRELWSDLPWREALRAPSRVARLDVGWVLETDRYFLLGACTGLVAQALVSAARLTQHHGRERYQRAVAETIATFTPYPGRVLVDDRLVHDGTVVLANVGGGRFRGGRFMVLPHSLLDDGLLDVCVVSGELDPKALPGLTADGSHVHRPEVTYVRGRRFVLERTDGEPLVFEHDGELQTTPESRYTIEVVPGALPVVVPSEPVESS
ncbi:diacylglycerol kinase family protein [Lentzea sp. NPDC042327]|uniref:diacylglycerol/lipid kinase family protein n=1 Tax=Lentzea sp. NPDC042327 TaxID=3154801 RepID=UPI0034083A44